MLSSLNANVRQYMLVTFNYWNFTITDGALRMLVVLYFHQLGFSALSIASLFLFYEFFGVVTNLIGGWLGARIGLNKTMNIGLSLQILALLMLSAPAPWLSLVWVMIAQAISGIAKDLNKMSAKSSIKALVSEGGEGKLFKWIAILTGSKNTLKGVGFFVGGLLLSLVGFQLAVFSMAMILVVVLGISLLNLNQDMGKAKNKPKFSALFSKSRNVNVLSAARLFLFGARDIWFVIALPIYLGSVFGWEHRTVGAFLAAWVIGYGIVQMFAPKLTGKSTAKVPDGKAAILWAAVLAIITLVIAYIVQLGWQPEITIVLGLLLFGAVFAVNSSLHSYLIVSFAKGDGVSLDVGFYYMANAMGRLVGTVLSGVIFQHYGFVACLWVSAAFLVITSLISIALPKRDESTFA